MSRIAAPSGLLLLSLAVSSCAQQESSAHPADATILEMMQPRAAHTATLLPDGRVLVAGGFTAEENTVSGVELFDPATNSFSRAAAMATPRQSHSATILENGDILFVGGYNAGGVHLASAEIYRAADHKFVPAGSLRQARAGQVAVRLNDGRVLITGGVGPGWEFLSSAEIFDPQSNTFSPAGPMQTPRESHAALRLNDGRVFVVGGHQGRRENLRIHAGAEIFDPAKGSFSSAGRMNIPRHKHDAVLLADGRVLITGGADERDDRGVYSSTEFFDPSSNTFRGGPHLQLPRYKHQGSSIPIPGGRIFIAGGAPQPEIFDPLRNSFALAAGSNNLTGQFSAAVLLKDGRVLVTGGYGARRGPQQQAWLFHPERSTPTPLR